MNYEISKEQSAIVTERARQRAAEPKWRVESEPVTMHDIAERLGITYQSAVARMSKLRKASGAITWDRLKALR